MKFNKKKNNNKMVEHKFVSLPAVEALWTLVTLLIKLIRILLKWKYIQDKNFTILAAMLRMRSYIGLKRFAPATCTFQLKQHFVIHFDFTVLLLELGLFG